MNDKTLQIFRELVGERASKLEASHTPADVMTRIAAALMKKEDSSLPQAVCRDMGFHLMDWQQDAAFLVALVLFPERFTDEEIRKGVDRFLVHAPAHVLEAARLGGYPTENIFAENGDTPE